MAQQACIATEGASCGIFSAGGLVEEAAQRLYWSALPWNAKKVKKELRRCAMKVQASVKRICENCKIVRRRGVVFVVCTNPRHKQRQG